jgi:protein-tyrosine phosphatase
MHCHILPGMDDGAKGLEQSVAMARALVEHGFQAVIATPHIMEQDGYRHTRDAVQAKVAELNAALAAEGVPLAVHPGAEYYLHAGVPDLLRQYHPLASLAGSLYVLVELPMMSMPPYTEYSSLPRPADPPEIRKTLPYLRPVIAHPERNQDILRDYRRLAPLREFGYYFQVNLESIMGWGGRHSLKAVQKMAKEGLIDFIGTDGLQKLLPGWRKQVDKVLGQKLSVRVLEENPQRVLKNELIETEEE